VEPILIVLLYSTLAASCAVLGALPLVGRKGVPLRWIGWANATAAGLMLGAAWALSEVEVVAARPLEAALGALVGIAFSFGSHRLAQTEELGLNRMEGADATYGYKVFLTGYLHSAAEGVAIGAAMSASLSFGIFMALAIAVHNVPEGVVLCAVLRRRNVRLRDGAGLAVVANTSQILLAIVVFAVAEAVPVLLPALTGFAAGALIYLVLVDLLPESYAEAGATPIALVTSLAMGMLILLHGVLT